VYAHDHPLVEGESLACSLQRWGRWDTFTAAVDLNLAIWIMDILLVSRYNGHVQKLSVSPDVMMASADIPMFRYLERQLERRHIAMYPPFR
jgi:hypothetical protein